MKREEKEIEEIEKEQMELARNCKERGKEEQGMKDFLFLFFCSLRFLKSSTFPQVPSISSYAQLSTVNGHLDRSTLPSIWIMNQW